MHPRRSPRRRGGRRRPRTSPRCASAPPRAPARGRIPPSACARCGRGSARRRRSAVSRAGCGYRRGSSRREEARACDGPAQVSGLRRLLHMGRPDYLPPPTGPILENRVTRRSLVLLLLLGSLAGPVAAGAQETPLQVRLAKALRVPHVAPARSGALAMDLTSGTVLFTQNPALPLAPASNEKLPVTYAALSNLGASYRIETDVLGEGAQNGPVFDWSIVLKGGGDPTLTTAGLRSLAAERRAAGIRNVTGRVVGDESSFDARRMVAGWKASFYIQESPPLSALVVNRARVGRYVTRTPALAAATAFRTVLRGAGIAVDCAA